MHNTHNQCKACQLAQRLSLPSHPLIQLLLPLHFSFQLGHVIVGLNSAYGERGLYWVSVFGFHKEENEITIFTMIEDFRMKEAACTAGANYKLGFTFVNSRLMFAYQAFVLNK